MGRGRIEGTPRPVFESRSILYGTVPARGSSPAERDYNRLDLLLNSATLRITTENYRCFEVRHGFATTPSSKALKWRGNDQWLVISSPFPEQWVESIDPGSKERYDTHPRQPSPIQQRLITTCSQPRPSSAFGMVAVEFDLPGDEEQQTANLQHCDTKTTISVGSARAATWAVPLAPLQAVTQMLERHSEVSQWYFDPSSKTLLAYDYSPRLVAMIKAIF